jgi:hypothetical protein
MLFFYLLRSNISLLLVMLSLFDMLPPPQGLISFNLPDSTIHMLCIILCFFFFIFPFYVHIIFYSSFFNYYCVFSLVCVWDWKIPKLREVRVYANFEFYVKLWSQWAIEKDLFFLIITTKKIHNEFYLFIDMILIFE